MTEARVLVLYTGGTIGMAPTDPDDPASPLRPLEDVTELIEGLSQLQALRKRVGFDIGHLRDERGMPIAAVDSSDVNATHWAAMARAVQESYEPYDGFVILHGTDTMAYSASALSFMLGDLAKPVVLTGSQQPVGDACGDAGQNLLNALHIAGCKATGVPLVPEVSVCFAGRLLRGNRARKMSTRAQRAFDTPNCPPLGEVGERIRIYPEHVRPPAEDALLHVETGMDRRVVDFALFPGVTPQLLERVLAGPDVRGVVLRTFGAGNAPTDIELLDTIGSAVQDGKVVVSITQCPQGEVQAGRYASSSGLLARGVISGFDLTPEAALTKLMWLLHHEASREAVERRMQIDQCGELSVGAR
jgi:L-asparaginase